MHSNSSSGRGIAAPARNGEKGQLNTSKIIVFYSDKHTKQVHKIRREIKGFIELPTYFQINFCLNNNSSNNINSSTINILA